MSAFSRRRRARCACAVATSCLVVALASPANAQEAPDISGIGPLSAYAPGTSGARERTSEEPEEEGGKKAERPIRVGPIVGVGVPSVMSFGLTAKITKYVGLGLNMGLIPTVRVPVYGEATIAYQEYDAYLRVYPFGGGFHVGSGIGYEKVTGSFTTTVAIPTIPGVLAAQDLSVTTDASVRSLAVTPQIGYLHDFDSGFLLGFDLGAQIPIAPSETSVTTNVPAEVPSQYTQAAIAEVRRSLDKFGQQVLPTLDVHVGWLF